MTFFQPVCCPEQIRWYIVPDIQQSGKISGKMKCSVLSNIIIDENLPLPEGFLIIKKV